MDRREHTVSRPPGVGQLVLQPGINGEGDVDKGLLWTLLHDLGLGIGEGGFEIAAREIDRQQILVFLGAEDGAQVVSAVHLLGGGLQQRQLGGTGAGECDLANADLGAADAEVEGLNGTVAVRKAQVVGATANLVFNEQRLQCVGDLVGEVAGHRQLTLEEPHALAQLLKQVLVGQPYKVVEARGDELVAVGDLQVELGAFGGILEAVGNIAEGAGIAQVLARDLKVSVTDGLAELQAGGADDLRLRVALAAGDGDGDEFESRGREFPGRGFAGLGWEQGKREAEKCEEQARTNLGIHAGRF